MSHSRQRGVSQFFFTGYSVIIHDFILIETAVTLWLLPVSADSEVHMSLHDTFGNYKAGNPNPNLTLT